MANFELIGYVGQIRRGKAHSCVEVCEYVPGRKDSDIGEIVGEKMDVWRVFFMPSVNNHLLRFKAHDLVIVKGTIHQVADKNSEYAYAVNGECIKHFYTRDLIDDVRREHQSQKANGDKPDLNDFKESDF